MRNRRITCIAFGLLAVLGAFPGPAAANFDLNVLDEIVGSYDGDPGQQYVEIRMLAAAQNQVAHAILAVFDAQGSYLQDLLDIPVNVSNAGAGVRWLVATPDFQAPHGLVADFTMPQNVLPATGGMLCLGGGGGSVPQNPPTWSRTNFANYIDCLAYGNYGGSSNALVGTPTSRAPLDHALQRIGETRDNAADFVCSDTLTPTTNAGATISLPSTIPCACGNGLVDANEDCDDGNQVDGDCCTRQCDFELSGSACASDGIECTGDVCNGVGSCTHPAHVLGTPCTLDAIECTDDACNGAGSCEHPLKPAGAPCTSDGNVCTDDYCDGATACLHPDNTAPCDDGDLCTPVDTCSGGSCVGDETPRVGCLATQAQMAKLSIKNETFDAKDRLVWKWTKGTVAVGDIGDPLTTTDTALCMYDHSGPAGAWRRRLSASAPHGGACAGKACWKALSSGAKYADKELTPDGVKSMVLKATTGAAVMSVGGQGPNLGLPALPLTGTITVQLANDTGACFGATFSTTLPTSDPTRLLKAKSD